MNNLNLDRHQCSQCEELKIYHFKIIAAQSLENLFGKEFDTHAKIYPEIVIDTKIVDAVNNYFCKSKPFNPAFIFYPAFNISYRISDETRQNTIKKVTIFLFAVRQLNAIDFSCFSARFPEEIIPKFLLPLSIPTLKEFQCQIFEKMDKEDVKIVKEIKENLFPKERNITMSDIASNKVRSFFGWQS